MGEKNQLKTNIKDAAKHIIIGYKIWFQKYTYKKEDLIYKVCYDKIHRPTLFQYIVNNKVDQFDFS